MKKKIKISDYFMSQKIFLSAVIFACFVPFTLAQGTKTNVFEDAAIDRPASNAGMSDTYLFLKISAYFLLRY